jgi:hypothetical protein
LLLLDGQVHHDTHAIPMGNYVIEAGNYVIATPSQLGNCVIADTALHNYLASIFTASGRPDRKRFQ